MNTILLNEYRCVCGKLLLKGIFFDGELEIKCKKCSKINAIGRIKLAHDDFHYILIVNAKGIIVGGSESAPRILGYSSDEFFGKHIGSINPTFSGDLYKRCIGHSSLLNEKNHFQLDTFHYPKKGKKIPVTVFLKLYKPTIKEEYTLIVVSLRKNGKRNVKKAQRERTFEGNACDFYFDIDKGGIIEYTNKSMNEKLGIIPESVIGKSFYETLFTSSSKAEKNMFPYFSKREEPFRERIKLHVTTGEVTWVEFIFTPNHDEEGRLIGYRVLGCLV